MPSTTGVGASPSCWADCSARSACGRGGRWTKPSLREVLAEGEAAEASTFLHGVQAFGFTILWTVSYYVFLTYMPTYTRTQLHLAAAQSLWASTASLLALVLLVPLMGDYPTGSAARNCCSHLAHGVRSADPHVLRSDPEAWFCQRHLDPDRFRIRDIVVLRFRTSGNRGDLSDARPGDLDVVILRSGGGDLWWVRPLHLAVADR
jgi:hypothetical protein